MTAETASDAAPAAPANGEAKKRPNGAPGSPVARGGPRAPKGPVAEPSAKPRGRGRGSAASRKHGHETVDGRPRAPLPGTSKRRTAGNGGARHSGEVVYVCQSYGFIRKDGDSSSEDIFMHLVDVDFRAAAAPHLLPPSTLAPFLAPAYPPVLTKIYSLSST